MSQRGRKYPGLRTDNPTDEKGSTQLVQGNIVRMAFEKMPSDTTMMRLSGAKEIYTSTNIMASRVLVWHTNGPFEIDVRVVVDGKMLTPQVGYWILVTAIGNFASRYAVNSVMSDRDGVLFKAQLREKYARILRQ